MSVFRMWEKKRSMLTDPGIYKIYKRRILKLKYIPIAYMTLGLVPPRSILVYSINVVCLICKEFTVVNSHMVKLGDIQSIVGAKGIGIYNTIWLHILLNNG